MARKLSFVFFFFVASLGMAQAPAVKAPPGTAALVNGQAVTESAVQRSLERIPPLITCWWTSISCSRKSSPMSLRLISAMG